MRFPAFHRTSLWWSLPILAAIIFAAGIFYAYSISRSNSKHLTQIREETYPFLENVNLLKAKLKSLQTGFYQAVSTADIDKLVELQNEKKEFMVLLNEIELRLKNQEVSGAIRALSEEYFKRAETLSQLYIEGKSGGRSIQPLIQEVQQKGAQLTEAIQNLNQNGNVTFKEALQQSEANSLLALRVTLLSAISGMIIIAGFSVWIVLLNVRLTSANQHLESANKNLEKQVKVRTAELESFVYTVSHDLKSPVVSMQGMASMFLQDYMNKVMDEKGKHYIERIIFNSNYMEELILGLLTLSRVGRKEHTLKAGEIKETLEGILTLNGDRFREKGIEVVVQPSLPHFIFDHVYLTQIFQNLVTNASKFMGAQPHPRIEIGGRELEGCVEFYVKDNGIGIDPEHHEKVFGIFQRLQEIEVEGTGVGLSIVKKIVDLAGGKIWVESRRGEGATFFVQLPKEKNRP